mgnify:CR=1 FL=1|jgi:hypothetical protein
MMCGIAAVAVAADVDFAAGFAAFDAAFFLLASFGILLLASCWPAFLQSLSDSDAC